MKIIHSIYFGFYLLINSLERHKNFSIGRAVNGTTFFFAFIIASVLELVYSILFCYKMDAVYLIVISISLSFGVNEYYFTYLEKGYRIVDKHTAVFNKTLSIILSLLAIPLSIYILAKAMDIAKEYISKCG